MTPVRPDPESPLTCGEIVTVVLDGRSVSVWWGPDGDDVDRVALLGGRVWTWSTADACADDARDRGWSGLGGDDTVGRTVVDVTPVQDWLRGRRTTVDPDAALTTWNLAGDVAACTGAPWPDRGRLADRCHTVLTAASVPWAFDLTPFEPRWTPADLRRLRAVLSTAVHVLRTELVTDRRAPRTT